MFLVRMSIGANRSSWTVLHTMKIKIFLIPAGIIFGTLAGTAIASLFLPSLKLGEVLAVGAGFGYYSLSSILITLLSGEALGVTALLSNIMREIVTLVATPLLVLYFGKLAGYLRRSDCYGHNPSCDHQIFGKIMEHSCGFQRGNSDLACTLSGHPYYWRFCNREFDTL